MHGLLEGGIMNHHAVIASEAMWLHAVKDRVVRTLCKCRTQSEMFVQVLVNFLHIRR